MARLLRGLLLVATMAMTLLAVGSPAKAHPTLLFTTPAAETADDVAPSTITLVFSEPVTATPDAISVRASDSRTVAIGRTAGGRGGRIVNARLTQDLPAGVYTVRWRVTGADGDLMEGEFRFGVGASVNPSSIVDNTPGTAWLTAVMRWALLAGLALTVAALLHDRVTAHARHTNPGLPGVPGWFVLGGILGGLATTVLVTQGLAASGGQLSPPAVLGLVQAVGFAVAAIARTVNSTLWTIAALAAVVIAESLRAHPNIAAPGWGALLTATHLTAAAVWTGILLHAAAAVKAWRQHRRALWWLLSVYGRIAVWAFAAVTVTGVINALLLISPQALLDSGYGRLLLAKIALIAAALVFAAITRNHLRRGPDLGGPAGRAARRESRVLFAVVAVTAALTATPPPTASSPQLPPSPKGPVLPLGTLAGQIGVGVAASDGQLVIRLSAPSRDDYYDPGRAAQRFTLTAALLTPEMGGAQDLRLQGCGSGCFHTSARWGNGDNLLTLDAQAPGWQGGTASLIIPWPSKPAADQLTRAVAVMRLTGEFTIYETVTSNTADPEPEPTPLTMTGAQFLPLQPYAAGVAPQVVALPSRPGDNLRLALGFPAEARYAELTIDPGGRIIEEVQTDPKHLTRRHYIYKEP